MVKRTKKKKGDAYNVMSEINSILKGFAPKQARKSKRPAKKDMTWPQAKMYYPKLKSMKDLDMDGVINILDCKPFNKKKQGLEHQYGFSSTASKRIKTVKMSPRKFLEETYKESQLKTTPEGDLKEGFIRFKGAGAPEKYETYEDQLRISPSHKGEKHDTAVEAIKDKIRSKEESVPIGFLSYEDGKPSGHEGRHTALAAQEMGIKKIPVTVTSYVSDEEPEVSKLPLHRKQYALPEQNKQYIREGENTDREHNVRAEVATYGEDPEALQSLDDEAEEEQENEENKEDEE